MVDRTYEVRITGHVLNEELLAQLHDVRIAEQEYRTVMTGRFLDQADLYAFVNLLRSFGLEVVEVRRVVDGDTVESEQSDENDGREGL